MKAERPGTGQKFVAAIPETAARLGVYEIVPTWCGIVPSQSWSDELHVHSQLEISYVLEGSGELEVDGRRLSIGSGDVLAVFPGELHRMRAERGAEMGLAFIGFEVRLARETGGSGVNEANRTIGAFLHSRERVKLDDNRYGVGGMMESFRRALESGMPGQDEITHRLAVACFMSAAWLFTSLECPFPERRAPGEWLPIDASGEKDSGGIFVRAERFIFANLRRDIRMSDIARHVNTSVRSLQRLFENRGFNYRMYSNWIRLDIAQFQLMATNRPIKIISRDVGYRSQAFFTEAFHKRFGMTPLEYRRLRGGD